MTNWCKLHGLALEKLPVIFQRVAKVLEALKYSCTIEQISVMEKNRVSVFELLSLLKSNKFHARLFQYL